VKRKNTMIWSLTKSQCFPGSWSSCEMLERPSTWCQRLVVITQGYPTQNLSPST
jgi:hypothetical protein